eukprot:274587-Prorocentrum_minimum.AAC.2
MREGRGSLSERGLSEDRVTSKAKCKQGWDNMLVSFVSTGCHAGGVGASSYPLTKIHLSPHAAEHAPAHVLSILCGDCLGWWVSRSTWPPGQALLSLPPLIVFEASQIRPECANRGGRPSIMNGDWIASRVSGIACACSLGIINSPVNLQVGHPVAVNTFEGIGREGVAALADWLKSFKGSVNVLRLYFRSSFISGIDEKKKDIWLSEQMEALAEGLKMFKGTLHMLDLQGSDIGDKGVITLAKALKVSKGSFHGLNLSGKFPGYKKAPKRFEATLRNVANFCTNFLSIGFVANERQQHDAPDITN